MGSPLSTPGAWVSIDAVSWMKAVSTQTTPESLLIDREEEAERDEDADERNDAMLQALAAERLTGELARIPPREALAMALYLGICGYPRTDQDVIAEVLGAASQQIVSYMVRRARVRLVYLASRPAVNVAALSSVLSPAQLAIVVDVIDTTSFADAARRRWTCPAELSGKQRHTWQRVRSNRIKREFSRALAKVERRTELAEEAAALRHLVDNLGVLSQHEGKGRHGRHHVGPKRVSGTASR